MSNLSFLESQICECEEYIEEYTKLVKMYADYNLKMNTVVSVLIKLKQNLINCETGFKNGGYIDNGETLDRGKLNETYTFTQEIIDEINSVIRKTAEKIREFQTMITKYRNDIIKFKSQIQRLNDWGIKM